MTVTPSSRLQAALFLLEEIDSVAREHPDVEIRQAPYLGASPGVVDLLLKQAAG